MSTCLRWRQKMHKRQRLHGWRFFVIFVFWQMLGLPKTSQNLRVVAKGTPTNELKGMILTANWRIKCWYSWWTVSFPRVFTFFVAKPFLLLQEKEELEKLRVLEKELRCQQKVRSWKDAILKTPKRKKSGLPTSNQDFSPSMFVRRDIWLICYEGHPHWDSAVH